jgi:hypothetical protein
METRSLALCQNIPHTEVGRLLRSAFHTHAPVAGLRGTHTQVVRFYGNLINI